MVQSLGFDLHLTAAWNPYVTIACLLLYRFGSFWSKIELAKQDWQNGTWISMMMKNKSSSRKSMLWLQSEMLSILTLLRYVRKKVLSIQFGQHLYGHLAPKSFPPSYLAAYILERVNLYLKCGCSGLWVKEWRILHLKCAYFALWLIEWGISVENRGLSLSAEYGRTQGDLVHARPFLGPYFL